MTTAELTCRSGLHPTDGERDYRGGCKACSEDARLSRVESRVERMRRLLSEACAPRPGWQADAECGGKDPTVFLPVDGQGLNADQIANANLIRHLKAKRSCGMCPVRRDCLGYALLGSLPPAGTWGGEFFVAADWTAVRAARKEMGL